VKADIPPEALCCAAMENQLRSWAETGQTLEIVAGRSKPNCKCLSCGATFTGIPFARLKGWYIDPRAWDIEEAPIAEATK
jgi:hypothetical protein